MAKNNERRRNRRLQRKIRRWDRRCRYCRERPSRTIDHILPVSKGGKSTIKNMVGACEECNRLKADALLEECGMVLYLPKRLLKFYTDRIEEDYVQVCA